MPAGQSATVFVALATMEPTPAKSSAGNVKNVPPPATAFCAPAAMAASARRTSVASGSMSVEVLDDARGDVARRDDVVARPQRRRHDAAVAELLAECADQLISRV